MRMLHRLVSKILELWHKIPGIRGAVNRLTACFHENSSVHGWNPDAVFLASCCWSDMNFSEILWSLSIFLLSFWMTVDQLDFGSFSFIFIHFPRFLPWNMAILCHFSVFFWGLPFSVTTLAGGRCPAAQWPALCKWRPPGGGWDSRGGRWGLGRCVFEEALGPY